MNNQELDLVIAATERLKKLQPGLACPFCKSESSFIHQQRKPPSSYALTVYDREENALESAYRLDLLSCQVCGYTMTFIPEMLSRFLDSLEHQQSDSDADEESEDASNP